MSERRARSGDRDDGIDAQILAQQQLQMERLQEEQRQQQAQQGEQS